MKTFTLQGRPAYSGKAEGEAIVCPQSIQGWSGVSDVTGCIIEEGHPEQGKCIKDKILILPYGNQPYRRVFGNLCHALPDYGFRYYRDHGIDDSHYGGRRAAVRCTGTGNQGAFTGGSIPWGSRNPANGIILYNKNCITQIRRWNSASYFIEKIIIYTYNINR